MAYIIGKTCFRHGTYGVGEFRGYSENDSNVMLIDFGQHGVKKFLKSSVKAGHLKLVVEEPNPCPETIPPHKPVLQPPVISPILPNGNMIRQYDSSETIVGDKNVLEAFDCEDTVIFNESYVIIGKETHAHIIRATYDLTVIGDISVSEISANGTLTVVGNITAKKINCSNSFLCQGSVIADNIYVGADIIAGSVKCGEFLCDGNAVIRTTIDIDRASHTEKTMVACEGIIGGGTFAAMYAIANVYFEFDGGVEGHVVELETGATLSEVSAAETVSSFLEVSIDEALAKIAGRIYAEYDRMGDLDEEALLGLTGKLSASALGELKDMDRLFEQLTQISYKNEIDELGDFLLVMYAREKLPNQLYRYETIEHVDSVLLPKAEKRVEDLEFIPSSVERIAQSLHIIMQMQGSLPLSAEMLCDKVFSSVGLRFSTVMSIMAKVGVPKVQTSAVSVTDPKTMPEPIEGIPAAVVQSGYKQNPIVATCSSQAEFLEKSLAVMGKSFGMTNDEIVRLGSVKIRTVKDFISLDASDVKDLYKKKPFLANHLISILKKMKAANKHMM